MRFGILGSVEAWGDEGNSIAVGSPRVRSLLALLLLNAGKVVPAEALIDGLYGEDPPANFVQGMHAALAGSIALSLIAAAGALVALKDVPPEIEAEKLEKVPV